MGTVERGESNLSFQNIFKVATTLGVSLSTLFQNLEQSVEELSAQAGANKSKKRTVESKS